MYASLLIHAARRHEDFLMFRFDVDDLVFVAIAVFAVFAIFGARRIPGRCPRCGENNREAALFCSQCGLRLPGR